MKKSLFILVMLSFFGLSVNAQCTIILNFDSTNGADPFGDLYYDGTYLYGMTGAGGAHNVGNVFKIKPDGSDYTNLLNFDSINGNSPIGSLISDGTYLYGMTQNGGTNQDGNVFKIKPDGSGYTDILDFDNTNGALPRGSLYYDGTYLYGMTQGGGANWYGNIFKIMTNGTSYADILDFNGTTNGGYPTGNLISDGIYLYGMTPSGGANDDGTIFKIKPDGSDYTKLLDFAGASNGKGPQGSLYYDGTYLYGMTQYGGTSTACSQGCGELFKIKPDGTDFDTLLNFNFSNGAQPLGSLISDGNFLYGMTVGGGPSIDNWGVIFKIKSDGSHYTKLFNFNGNLTNGSYFPQGSLISAGAFLYGTAESGGTFGQGVVFKIDSNAVADINEISENNNVVVYPNPASEFITISNRQWQEAVIEITNIQGQLVKSLAATCNKTNIDVSALPSGMYIVEVKTEKGISVSKFIKE